MSAECVVVVAIANNTKSRLILVNIDDEGSPLESMSSLQIYLYFYQHLFISLSVCLSRTVSISTFVAIFVSVYMSSIRLSYNLSVYLKIHYLSINLSTLMISSKVIYLFSEDGSPEILTDKLQ